MPPLDLQLRRLILVCIALGILSEVAPAAEQMSKGKRSQINYARDIRPLLATNCFACHGPDEETREADLRLDTFAGATTPLGDHQAITPGKIAESELIARITSDDEFEVMPPPDSGKSLKPAQIELIKQWISQGAEYAPHWAFQPPTTPPVPLVNDVPSGWQVNPIDAFTFQRMQEHGLSPSQPADRFTLIRRVSLDLIGLPPSKEEVAAFLSDESPEAYQNLVDRLLASPQYGERWARRWLDLARYADTNGYEKDRPRSIWPYRDWVINALNDDMPFDQFSIKQLAGDMLPDATLEDRIATGFHRNTMLNEEGGIDPLEYRFYAMVDRVATTGTTWLGMTIGCAQCHTHKYDPITHTDYYQLFALLNNADEPDLSIPSAEVTQQQQTIEEKIEDSTAHALEQLNKDDKLSDQFHEWLTTQHAQAINWQVVTPSKMSTNLPRLELLDDGSILSTGDITKRDVFQLTIPVDNVDFPVTALRLEVLPDERLPAGGPGRAFYEGRKGDFFLSELTASHDGAAVAFTNPSHSFGKIAIGSGSADAANVLDGDGSTGWSTATREGEPHELVLNLEAPITKPTTLQFELLFERHFAASLGRFRLSVGSSDAVAVASPLTPARQALRHLPESELNEDQMREMQIGFLLHAPEAEELRKPIEALRSKVPELPQTMVFEERHPDNPRATYRHHRGEYLKPKEEVIAGIPAIFSNSDHQSPRDRLEFAKWLVGPNNPLVGRVVVNRAWQSFFGRGFVKTLGDLGTQSELPTHPELLDWLATQFTNPHEMNWSLKELHRTIVLSQTYQQSSIIDEQHTHLDPENLWLSRGPRVRLDAEMIRDAALQASGLLSTKLGGPSVYPPQPAEVTALGYGGFRWNVSTGEDRYRRSLYTFAKRTTPFAAYTVFDGPTGESCLPRRDRSNTPLQALTLLNDSMFLEAAQALAEQEFQSDLPAEHIAQEIFRSVLTRNPTPTELAALVEYQHQQCQRFSTGALAVNSVAGEGAGADRAAWVLVARVLFNLDEFVTKQ